MKNLSIVRKLILGTSFLAILIAGTVTWVTVNKITQLAKDNANNALSAQVSEKAEFAHGYFQRYQAMVDVFLANQDLKSFAEERQNNSASYDTPLFEKIHTNIKVVSGLDPKLITTFFLIG
ncbi:hypothetical protein CS022_02130 [Veronia nyctiphanis]|uniref:Uncharacterized protein n=1 Tax=Veronia nyctiphanis TaxID=1278244 RepID=A0A4V1LT96_9GAMM|nr:hypothetical protein [Veronia nyctiphanis]RXJ74428.1 hypothetical protein CS022_02130 [Veronia nyctiphanis]